MPVFSPLLGALGSIGSHTLDALSAPRRTLMSWLPGGGGAETGAGLLQNWFGLDPESFGTKAGGMALDFALDPLTYALGFAPGLAKYGLAKAFAPRADMAGMIGLRRGIDAVKGAEVIPTANLPVRWGVSGNVLAAPVEGAEGMSVVGRLVRGTKPGPVTQLVTDPTTGENLRLMSDLAGRSMGVDPVTGKKALESVGMFNKGMGIQFSHTGIPAGDVVRHELGGHGLLARALETGNIEALPSPLLRTAARLQGAPEGSIRQGLGRLLEEGTATAMESRAFPEQLANFNRFLFSGLPNYQQQIGGRVGDIYMKLPGIRDRASQLAKYALAPMLPTAALAWGTKRLMGEDTLQEE